MAQQVEHVLGKMRKPKNRDAENPVKIGEKLHLLLWLSR